MYRVYVTDALKGLIEIQAARCGNSVDYRRFYDFIDEKSKNKEEKPEETAEDVIARITNNMRNMGN